MVLAKLCYVSPLQNEPQRTPLVFSLGVRHWIEGFPDALSTRVSVRVSCDHLGSAMGCDVTSFGYLTVQTRALLTNHWTPNGDDDFQQVF